MMWIILKPFILFEVINYKSIKIYSNTWEQMPIFFGPSNFKISSFKPSE